MEFLDIPHFCLPLSHIICLEIIVICKNVKLSALPDCHFILQTRPNQRWLFLDTSMVCNGNGWHLRDLSIVCQCFLSTIEINGFINDLSHKKFNVNGDVKVLSFLVLNSWCGRSSKGLREIVFASPIPSIGLADRHTHIWGHVANLVMSQSLWVFPTMCVMIQNQI